MSDRREAGDKLFDPWPNRYDAWFETPIGTLVKDYESALLLDLLQPRHGESILDAGCGTGMFTLDILSFGARVFGLEISLPMLMRARQKAKGLSFQAIAGDMMSLPFADEAFDKAVSVTALEFIEDARFGVRDLFRVTKKGGIIVVTTLNSLSPWATRRKQKAEKGHRLFQNMIFRSPDEVRATAPVDGVVKTAIHFSKDEDPDKAPEIEREGQKKNLNTGAFLAAKWQKPFGIEVKQKNDYR
jgi:ubiquinone/menaquinone biosynthesis C-methylase UbiE